MRLFSGLAAIVASLALTSSLSAEPKSLPSDTPVRDALVATPAQAPAIPTDTEPVLEAAKPMPVAPAIVARINLSSQRMEVAVNGQPVHSWAVSSGRSGYATPRGTFRVQWTSRMWYSRKYDNAPMPHAVFFNGGVAVHATSSVGMLGRPASHGCIRLAPGHAAQFYALVQRHGNQRTQIQVLGGAPSDRVAERREGKPDRELRRPAQRSVAQRSVAQRSVAQRPVAQQLGAQQPGAQQPGAQRLAGRERQYATGPSGMLYLGPQHASFGQASFVQNGVRYVRVR